MSGNAYLGSDRESGAVVRICRRLIRLALAAGTVATLAACGGSPHGSTVSTPATTSNPQEQEQQGWLGHDATSATFLQWVENPDHTLTGQVDQFSTIPDNTFTAAITGVHRGSSVSLTMSAAGTSYTANGTLQGRTLTLNFAQPDGTI
ncbi:MAG: hypothetical protein KGJ86_22775, partial [Chloroflexota bacterium]|nr:hypothetical protein [Chloroflexota bacterium]